jgi:hypothetical protein
MKNKLKHLNFDGIDKDASSVKRLSESASGFISSGTGRNIQVKRIIIPAQNPICFDLYIVLFALMVWGIHS